jgi:prepilin-type N-terminal cleavage/methylation domain-containing protein
VIDSSLSAPWAHLAPDGKKHYNKRDCAAGLTLIELVVTLAIITIVSGIALGVVNGSRWRNLHNASQVLQADLRRIQRQSIIEGRSYSITFQSERQYTISPHPLFLNRDAAETVDLPTGVRIQFRTRPIITYLPRGTVSAGGYTIRLENGSHTQVITGNGGSGRVELGAIAPRT